MKKTTDNKFVFIAAILAILFAAMFLASNDASKKQIADLTAELADRDSRIAELTETVDGQTAQLDTLTAESAESSERIAVLEQGISDRDTLVQSLSEESAGKDAQFAELQASAEESAARIETLEQGIADREALIESLNSKLKDKESRLEELTERIGKQGATIGASNEALTQFEAQIAELQASAEESAARIKVLEQGIVDRDALIESMADELKDKESRLEELTERIEKQGESLDASADALAEANTQLQVLTGDNAAKELQIASLEEENEILRQQVEDAALMNEDADLSEESDLSWYEYYDEDDVTAVDEYYSPEEDSDWDGYYYPEYGFGEDSFYGREDGGSWNDYYSPDGGFDWEGYLFPEDEPSVAEPAEDDRLCPYDEACPASDFLYVTNGVEILITGYQGSGGNVSIPSQINGLPVTGIASLAFCNDSSIETLSLPESLKTIGEYSFAYMEKLSDVLVMPETLTRIGTGAFQGSGLQVLVLNSGCMLEPECFADNDALELVCILDGCAARIGEAAFAGDVNLGLAMIPDSVTELAEDVFYGCDQLCLLTPEGSAAADYAAAYEIWTDTEDYDYVVRQMNDLLAELSAASADEDSASVETEENQIGRTRPGRAGSHRRGARAGQRSQG